MEVSRLYPRIDIYEHYFHELKLTDLRRNEILKDALISNCWGIYLEKSNKIIPFVNSYATHLSSNDKYVKHEIKTRMNICNNLDEFLDDMKIGDRLVIYMTYEVSRVIRLTKIENGYKYEDTMDCLYTKIKNKLPKNVNRYRFISNI